MSFLENLNNTDNDGQNELFEIFAAFCPIMQMIFSMHNMSQFPGKYSFPSGCCGPCFLVVDYGPLQRIGNQRMPSSISIISATIVVGVSF